MEWIQKPHRNTIFWGTSNVLSIETSLQRIRLEWYEKVERMRPRFKASGVRKVDARDNFEILNLLPKQTQDWKAGVEIIFLAVPDKMSHSVVT